MNRWELLEALRIERWGELVPEYHNTPTVGDDGEQPVDDEPEAEDPA